MTTSINLASPSGTAPTTTHNLTFTGTALTSTHLTTIKTMLATWTGSTTANAITTILFSALTTQSAEIAELLAFINTRRASNETTFTTANFKTKIQFQGILIGLTGGTSTGNNDELSGDTINLFKDLTKVSEIVFPTISLHLSIAFCCFT